MALVKQPVSINFQKGLNTKADPFQVQVGNFLALNNTIFDTTGRLTKRNGFKNVTTLPNNQQSTLTTLNDNLIATGSNLFAFSQDTNQWLNQGIVQPVQLSVQSIVRSSTSQVSPDIALAANGLACAAYVDSNVAYYQVSDSATNQQIVKRTALPATATNPRVFVLGAYFIITFMATVGGAAHLQYINIPTANPNNPGAAKDFNTTVSSLNSGYDGVVANNTLYLAWGSSSTNVAVSFLTAALAASPVSNITGNGADLVSVTADLGSQRITVSYWDSGTTNGFTSAFDYQLDPVMSSTPVITGQSVAVITSVADNGVIDVFYEVINDYGYDSAIRTDFVSKTDLTLPVGSTGPGTVISNSIMLRSVGLASKAFIADNSTTYMLVAYGDTNQTDPDDNSNQPSYFLVDDTGAIYMRLAYSNGGGYARSQVLPSVNVSNDTYSIAYLIADFLTTVNKGTNNPAGTPSNAIYTQTGINLASFTLNTAQQYSSEIAGVLNLTGGQLWQYDGVKPVENNFQVWPENVEVTTLATGGGLTPGQYFYQFTYEWTDNQGNLYRSAPSIPVEATVKTSFTTTGTFSSGASGITVPSTAGMFVGQSVTDLTANSTIPSGTTIVQIFSGTVINISNATSAASVSGGDTIQIGGGLSTTATFATNANTMTVTSASGLFVGQVLTDYTTPASLQANTVITSISGTTIGISLPTNAPSGSGGDVVFTLDTGSNTINVPTLRLTYKVDPNPVRIVGYRWGVNQQIYYQFTDVRNPVVNSTTIDYVTFNDSLSDQSILGQTLLYTTGGVIEDIAAPASIASALFSDRLWLIDAEDRNLLWFSKQIIEATPVEMSDLLTVYVAPTLGAQGSTGDMTALGAMDDKLIIFKKDAAYYINGIGPDNTGANSTFSDPIFITSTVGCNNPNSVVLIPNGVMFQSDKGIWLLGRDLSTTYIGADVEKYNNYQVKSATAIPGTNQVRFILNNNITLVYDYYYSQWATHSNINAISATLYQGAHTYLNGFGQVFQETPGTYVDGSTPVLLSLTTSWINIAGLQGFERFYFANLLGTYFTPFKLDVTLAYDYNSSATQAISVVPDNSNGIYGVGSVYGSNGNYGGSGNIFSERLFPDKQKCQSFQMSINEVYDSSLGVAPGEGLSLSGLALIVGVKKGYRTQSAAKSFGGS